MIYMLSYHSQGQPLFGLAKQGSTPGKEKRKETLAEEGRKKKATVKEPITANP